jgi:hypothetical protein
MPDVQTLVLTRRAAIHVLVRFESRTHTQVETLSTTNEQNA